MYGTERNDRCKALNDDKCVRGVNQKRKKKRQVVERVWWGCLSLQRPRRVEVDSAHHHHVLRKCGCPGRGIAWRVVDGTVASDLGLTTASARPRTVTALAPAPPSTPAV